LSESAKARRAKPSPPGPAGAALRRVSQRLQA
jgi:hypothetical protein